MLDIEFDDDFLMAPALDGKSGIHISWLIVTNDSILEMCEDIFFLDFDLSSMLLMIIIEGEIAVWTDDGIVILGIDVL